MSDQDPRRPLYLNIEREYFAEILALPRRKKIEYRTMGPYWLRRLENAGRAPFNLRLRNGMQPKGPVAIMRVERVVRNRRTMKLEFHLGRVLKVLHWDRRRECPTR